MLHFAERRKLCEEVSPLYEAIHLVFHTRSAFDVDRSCGRDRSTAIGRRDD